MKTRAERPYVPYDFLEKTLLAAIDAGKLGNYIFDNQTSRSHAALRLGTNKALTFKPVKRFLRSGPVQSILLRLLRIDDRI